MSALARLEPLPIRPPTPDAPIPMLDGAPGLTLLMSASAATLAMTVKEEETPMLVSTCHAVLASVKPASTLEIGAVLEGLALHFPQFRRTDGENRIAIRHWAEDLEGWPLDLVVEAARLWRNSAAERFPTPGQFKKQMETVLAFRRTLGRRAAAYLAEVREER